MEEIKFEKVPVGIFDKVKSNKEEFVEKFIDELEELFPETVKDGNVDFQALLERFGEYQDRNERYELTWVGKDKARQESFEDIVGKTLKYIEEDSKNPERTENLYIEGDNLEVLKLLRKSYYGKIKMIYIDPPYNTGNDFVYKDDFAMSKEEYDKLKGDLDEYGERLVKNSADSGRYHSNWLNMMYPRLQVARDLLTEDGVIFISIDDNEVHNLRKICDEIFKEENFVNSIAVKMSEPTGVKMAHQYLRYPKLKEHILFYKKPKFKGFYKIDKYKTDEWDKENNIFLENINEEDRKKLIKLQEKEINNKDDVEVAMNILKDVKRISLSEKIRELNIQPDKVEEWCFKNAYRIIKTCGSDSLLKVVKGNPEIDSQEIASALSANGVMFFYITDYNRNSASPRLRVIFADENIYRNPCDFWQDIKTSGAISNEGGVKYTNGKKPLKLLKRIIKMNSKNDDIILDFFSGSASTAHAVMDLNAEDNGNRKFIMVQLPENLDETLEKATGEAKKDIRNLIKILDEINKPHYLTEIGKERINRSEIEVKENHREKNGIENLDTGFKVFRVEDTNLRRIKEVENNDIDTKYKSLSEKDLEDFNPHFTDLDIVYELMLRRQDIELTEEIKKLDSIGDRTFIVGDTMLVCLEEKVTEEMVEKIGKINTDLSWIILRDSAFDDDCDLKVNTTRKLRSIIKSSKKKDQKIYWI